MAQHPPFNGYQQAVIQPRGWNQSPTTYVDVPEGTDAHLRPLKVLVESTEMKANQRNAAMVKASNSKSRTGENPLYYFEVLRDSGVMDFMPHEFDNADEFHKWLELTAFPVFSRFAQFTPKKGGKAASRRTCQDMMANLSNWMANHGVSPHAIQEFDRFRSKTLWSILGDKAAPTTKARKQAGDLLVSPALMDAMKARLDDLLTNPDAEPLFHEFDMNKDGSRKQLKACAIRALNAAFYLALNNTSRTGEISKMKVRDVDFENGLIFTTVRKITSGIVGDLRHEVMWDATREACAAYIEGRRLARLRVPEAALFSDLPVKWRSLMKDVMGDDWREGLGIHKFSRNRGVQTIIENGGGLAHIMASGGFSAATAQTYIDGANLQGMQREANEIKRKAYEKQGLLGEKIAAVENSMSDLLRAILTQDAVDFARKTGEAVQFDQFVADAVVHQAKVSLDEDGNTVITPQGKLAPRERFELPRDTPTAKQLLSAIQVEAQEAIDAWMEGDTKAALTLLKTLVGGGQ